MAALFHFMANGSISVTFVGAMMLLALALLMQLMLFGAGDVFANSVAYSAMLFISVAMRVALGFFLGMFHPLAALRMFLGIIAECDLGPTGGQYDHAARSM